MIFEKFLRVGEYGGAGMYEEPDRSLFYRKALGIRRFYEHCELAIYNGELLYPSGVVPNKMNIYPWYLNGMSMNYQELYKKDPELAERYVSEFDRYHSTVPEEHSVAGNMYTHSMPNYERILKEGLLSYKDRIGKIDEPDLREGLLHIVEGIQKYLERCVTYLEETGAKKELIDALKKVPLYPAETIYEAVVAWNFILYLDNCDNLGCVASGLLPYYQGEDVTKLLENLYDNLDRNGGYSMALDGDNPLALQCLEASKGKRRPMIELLVKEDTPDEVWEKAFEVIRTGNGQPAFYNEKVIRNGLINRFPTIRPDDVKKFCGGGCTEAMLAGLSNVGSLDAGINLLLVLEQVMQEKLAISSTFEEFYKYYIDEVSAVVDTITANVSSSREARAKYNPVPMRTLLVDDCIDKGVEYNQGGARYNWSIINFAGMINVIDAMLVIRDLIFVQKKYGAEEMLHLLEEENTEFLQEARMHEVSFGKGNEDANGFAERISTEIASMLDQKEVLLGEGFLPASIQFMSQVDAGKKIGATPDGREKGTPLCDSLGAIFGKDTKGPTALLESVTSLDLKRFLGIPILNFNVEQDFSNALLKALILGYMKLGGIQIQLTCTSLKTLQEAYENPKLHRNLVVRVGGYSEYFHALSDELKKMVINRSIQKLEV